MSTLLALFIIYGEASRLIFEEIQSKIFSLVVNSKQRIDTETLEKFIERKGNQNSSEYQELEKDLMEIQRLNRRSDIYVEHVYILKKYPDSNHYYYVIEALDEGEKDRSVFGSFFSSTARIPPGISEPYVINHIYSDEWGTYLSGYAPIYDSNGLQIALLGIDVRTKEIYVELERLLLFGLVAFAISIFVAIIFAYFLSKEVSSSLAILSDTVKKIGEGDLTHRCPLHTQDEFNELSLAINHMVQGLEERERLKQGFARYVSQYALDELLKLDKPITLEGERKKVTVLFSDLRDFTKLSEDLPPEEVLKLLNEYYKEMLDVIFNYGGTLDKFIGDGMMIEFGAPLDDKEQELHAVLAAVHMQLQLKKLSEKWSKEGKMRLEMGIGIHAGLAVLGNIGSEKRMEYTAIGDAVNVASRLERAAKKVNKEIVISKAVYEKVKDQFVFEELKELEIPGRKGVIEAYSLDPFSQKLQ